MRAVDTERFNAWMEQHESELGEKGHTFVPEIDRSPPSIQCIYLVCDHGTGSPFRPLKSLTEVTGTNRAEQCFAFRNYGASEYRFETKGRATKGRLKYKMAGGTVSEFVAAGVIHAPVNYGKAPTALAHVAVPIDSKATSSGIDGEHIDGVFSFECLGNRPRCFDGRFALRLDE